MNNAYGLDADYFIKLCSREFNPDVIRNQNPEDLARAFARAARTACAEVLEEPEFSGALSAEVERLKAALQAIYDTDYQAPHDATDDEVSTSRKLCIFRIRKQASAALAGKEGE